METPTPLFMVPVMTACGISRLDGRSQILRLSIAKIRKIFPDTLFLPTLRTANLNEKNLTTNSTWDFDATFYTSDFN